MGTAEGEEEREVTGCWLVESLSRLVKAWPVFLLFFFAIPIFERLL